MFSHTKPVRLVKQTCLPLITSVYNSQKIEQTPDITFSQLMIKVRF